MICQPMNSNVTNVIKNFPFSYQSQIIQITNHLIVLNAKVKALREYSRVLLL
jgi:hypothetical protein